jgi:phenylalanyl-tRNA synthetase alpha chain
MEVLHNFKNEALALITEAETEKELETLRVKFLGRKGQINKFVSELKKLPPQKKSRFGQLLNQTKKALEQDIEAKKNNLTLKKETSKIWFDITTPGKKPKQGNLHLVTQVIEEIETIFKQIGFIRVRYPEVDWDWYAFEALNMPKNHPARDEWETFFIDAQPHKNLGKMVLTPHTSNGQIREMERLKSPPIRMINIAKCHRRQQDVTHTVMFHQFEGLLVDENVSISHLKGITDYFARQFYGPKRKTRLRPFNFSFTEPSFEIDINCPLCLGKGCRTCKSGWHELGGAGMVHPNVLKAVKIDPEKYSGFAFGWGVERTYLMKEDLKIKDLRLIYSNDLRFLKQF